MVNEHNFSYGDTIIVNSSILGIVMGRNKHDKTLSIKLLNTNYSSGRIIRVNMNACMPATKAAWLLYGNGPISNFFKILEKGTLSED